MKSSLYVVALLLIATGLTGYLPNPPSEPKPVELADMVSLRQLPGADGCEPGTIKPSHVDGFPDTCADATVYY